MFSKLSLLNLLPLTSQNLNNFNIFYYYCEKNLSGIFRTRPRMRTQIRRKKHTQKDICLEKLQEKVGEVGTRKMIQPTIRKVEKEKKV